MHTKNTQVKPQNHTNFTGRRRTRVLEVCDAWNTQKQAKRPPSFPKLIISSQGQALGRGRKQGAIALLIITNRILWLFKKTLREQQITSGFSGCFGKTLGLNPALTSGFVAYLL